MSQVLFEKCDAPLIRVEYAVGKLVVVENIGFYFALKLSWNLNNCINRLA